MKTIVVVLLVAVAWGASLCPGAPPSAGQKVFQQRCGGCHSLDRDLEGPRLRGVFGRAAASVNGFPYSEALRNSKVVWTEETLDRWLTDTETVAPNNEMTFRVNSPSERRAIIEFLKSNGK